MEKREGGTGGEEPTRELPTVPTARSEDHCTNCGASLLHDQRYCVECGERRGQSRFPVAPPVTEAQTSRTAAADQPRRRPALSSGTTLVAGVGVLLLAIGLGWLIGHNNNNNNNTNTQRASAPQVITVQGGSGAAAATTTPTTTTTAHLSKKSKAKLKAAAATTAAPPPAVQKKATEAAGKVLGNSKNLAPPTVTTGGACSNGQAGCSGGHFSGNFFGN